MRSCASTPTQLKTETQPLSLIVEATCGFNDVGGNVVCKTQNAVEPVSFDWLLPDGSPALLALSRDRSQACDVPSGTYTIRATDSSGRVVEQTTYVSRRNVPAVVQYSVVHASSDTARNGEIVATVEGTADMRMLWTTGVVTEGPRLMDVSPGIYTGVPLGAEMHLQGCPPAVVLPSRT